ncbi:EamA family transporter [Halobellus rufus]|uniref:EamA family transporter n=1 Tax=Halobellus rufus TaxID=1448860 RepID=UPI0006786E12|nr:DMT family transporter [Halobellus rufus]
MFSLSPGIGYSLLAALVWGTYIFILKQYFEGYPSTVITVGVNAAAVLWYLPLTVSRTAPADVPDVSSFGVLEGLLVVGTIVATAAAFLVFLGALERGEVSYVAPISKIVPVFVLPIEVVFLHERLTPLQVTGVVVATLAVYVANYRTGSLLDPIRKAATSRAAQLGLLSAAFFAVSDVGKRVALQELALPLELWVPTVLGGVLVVVLPLAVREWVPIRDALPKFLLAGGGVALGEHVTSLALSTVPASIASPIINTQAVVAVLLGGVLLREDSFGIRLAAAALAVVGVGLIAV